MSPEDRAEIKQKITDTIVQVKSEIAKLEEFTKPIHPENAIGRVSRMDAINNRSVNLAALRQSKSRLKMLEAASVKVNQPTYGKCASCGNDIPIPRLKFRPESSRCVNCARR